MVKAFKVILRRQWTDKLKRQSLRTVIPHEVRVVEGEDEVILDSHEPYDFCKTVNMIKQLVVEQQLVGSGRSTSAECNGLDKTNQDDMKRWDQETNQKGVPVDDGRNSSLEDEKHDLSRSRTAKVDSGKDDNNKKEAKQEQKGGSQRVQHRGRARQLKGHSSTEGSIEGEEDTDGKAVLMKSKVACRLDNPAHYSEKVDQEIDEEQEQIVAPVEDGKTSSLKNEHDHSLPGTAKNDSGKPKHNREDAQPSRKEKNQKDIDGKGASMNSEAANGHDGTAPDFMQVDREMDKDQKQKDLPVEDRKTSSLENEDRSRPGIAKNDSGKTKRDRKDAHQSETKKNQKGVSHPEQHRSAGHQARRQTGHLSTEDSNPDEEDSQDDAATRNVETASAAESVQTSTDDVQGMRARTRNTEPRTERLQDNAGETNIFPNDDDKSAAFTGTQEKCRVREHIWAYIQFIDPESQWDKKFSVFSDTKQDNDTVELTGSSADIDSFKKFCDTARFQRAIVRKMQRVPERLTAKVFRDNLLDLGLSQRKVLVRLRDDDLRSCEFVGKRSEITELEKAISDKFPELVEKQQTSDIQQSTTLTRPASVINEAASQLSAETTKQMSETGLEFQTERSQLRVRIVTGDLLEWRCEVLVNSCDGDLSHAGGLSWLFAKAAGPKMQADCTAYIRQYGRLPQCEIMSTVAGDLPVRRIIHAHGPDARSYRDLNDCRTKLEKTFFNCLVHANDILQARSIALPALSSGAQVKDMTARSSNFGSEDGNRQVMQLDYTKMKRVAEKKGLAIVDVPMDGDCALHAIVRQLQQQACYSYDVRMLRAQATKQLELYRDLVDFTMLRSCYNGDIKAYLRQQAVPGTLCDNAMLHAVATLTERNIHVFDDDGSHTTFERHTADPRKLITIGRIADMHYVSLEARGDAPGIKDPNRAHDFQTISTASAARGDRFNTHQHYQEPKESEEAVLRSSYSRLKAEAEKRQFSVDDDVPKNGDSALHAVVKQLHLQGIRLYDVTTLRKRAVGYLHSHKHLIDKNLSKAQSYLSAQSGSEIPCDWTMLSAVSEVITKEIHILHDDGHLEKLEPKTSYTKPVVIGVYADVCYVSLVEPPGSKHKYQTTSHIDTETRDDRRPETAIQHATPSATDGAGSDKSPNSTCAICMDVITDPKTLSCKHVFCSECIDQSLAYQPKCPSCGKIFGVLKGDQPTGGTMHVRIDKWLDLEGYPRCGRIVIDYYIPDGRQKENHPNPGQRYKGARRTAYLPGNAEGEEICQLLKRAFDAGLIFTVGTSTTSGQDNVVTWNDIHHKTKTSGPFGYPDATYLARVRDELAAKGITSETPSASAASRSSR